jgi:hypothetical protein
MENDDIDIDKWLLRIEKVVRIFFMTGVLVAMIV